MFLFALWTTHAHVESCARLSTAPPGTPLRSGRARHPREIPPSLTVPGVPLYLVEVVRVAPRRRLAVDPLAPRPRHPCLTVRAGWIVLPMDQRVGRGPADHLPIHRGPVRQGRAHIRLTPIRRGSHLGRATECGAVERLDHAGHDAPQGGQARRSVRCPWSAARHMTPGLGASVSRGRGPRPPARAVPSARR